MSSRPRFLLGKYLLEKEDSEGLLVVVYLSAFLFLCPRMTFRVLAAYFEHILFFF